MGVESRRTRWPLVGYIISCCARGRWVAYVRGGTEESVTSYKRCDRYGTTCCALVVYTVNLQAGPCARCVPT